MRQVSGALVEAPSISVLGDSGCCVGDELQGNSEIGEYMRQIVEFVR